MGDETGDRDKKRKVDKKELATSAAVGIASRGRIFGAGRAIGPAAQTGAGTGAAKGQSARRSPGGYWLSAVIVIAVLVGVIALMVALAG